MFASDLHGSVFYCKKMFELFEKEGADQLILLGDLLYHGARNDLTIEYDTRRVTDLLNAHADKIVAVRGNCDSEVDQEVLDFPIQSDYFLIYVPSNSAVKFNLLFITHGHMYNLNHLPKLHQNYILIHGHTHIYNVVESLSCVYLNPGSISCVRSSTGIRSYMIYDGNSFQIKDIDRNILAEYTLQQKFK
jgi:putative phosphoesterase